MFKSLRSKIVLVMAGIVLVTTMTIMFFVQRETEKAILTEEDEDAQNLLHTIVLNVENEYKSLLFNKAASLERRKSELKNITTLAISCLERFYQKYKAGILSESEAKQRAMETIRHLRYDDHTGYVWISGMGRPIPRMIMHPTVPELEGTVLDDPKFDCALGVRKNLFVAFVDICQKDGEGYVDYLWPKPTQKGLTAEQPKLSYVRLFKAWNWVVGTGVYIDDIERDARKQLRATIDRLRQTFSKVKVAQTGYMYLFNGRKEMLIHPTLEGTDCTALKNPVTGNFILDELIEATKSPGRAFKYVWEKPDHRGEFRFRKKAYMAYFEPLDWYIGASVYLDEINALTRILRKKILYLSILFFAVAFILSLLVSRSLTKPLWKLTLAAKRIEERGTASAEKGKAEMVIDVVSKDEIGDLAESFRKMIRRLNEITIVAESVASGDYSRSVEISGEGDQLGKAICQMTENLQQITDESKKEDWLKTGQTELNERMRGDQDSVMLTQNILNYLATYLDVQVGVCYLADEEGIFRLMSSFAYKMRNNNYNTFEMGEGLIGQAALEKKSILFTGVPEDHVCLTIHSGMGVSPARSIFVLPLIYEESVLGVMGFGTSRNFTVTETELLDRVAENIAVSIHSARSRVRMKELLKKTRKQSETLKIQQEELQTNNEELEEQARILKNSEQRLKAQSMELQMANEELEEKSELLERQKVALEDKNIEVEKKAEEVELASKYKSEFLANMSHELRTPLNSLLILAKLLFENEEGNLTEEQVKSARIIYSGGHELLTLINDILDLSKIEAGKMEIHIEDMKTDVIVANLRNQFNPVAKEKGVEFRVEKGQIPPIIKTDGLRAEQILKNLLSNAFKFTHKGSVLLSIRYPDPGVQFLRSTLTPETAIAFSVIDTGVGIPEKRQKAIFEAFQQADGSTSRKYGGTGLGLAISRELSKRLGGEIQIQSEENKGSVFTLFLPATRETCKTAEVSKTSAIFCETEVFFPLDDDRNDICEKDKSILAIEDDIRFAGILGEFIRKKGYRFLTAGDGRTGQKMASEYRPVGIILDIGLPDTDGLSVLDNLKADPRTRDIPVHIISSQDQIDDPLKRGAIGYLTKPVTHEAINEVLSEFGNRLKREIKELLIVEDDPGSQTAIIRLIENKGIRITVAEKGEDAYQKIITQKFDCVVLDLGLPDMTGFELLERLGTEMSGESSELPPVIIYTARQLTDPEHRELSKYAKSIVIKGADSSERLLDEISLFLHTVESSLPEDQKKGGIDSHDSSQVLKDKKILLADDDFRNTFALAKVLKNYGIKIIMADNGQLAFEKLESEGDVDLVIMDIMMPVMDGYEAIQKIRTHKRFENLPVIALTAKAMPEDRAKCIEAGANDYLSKPIDEERMISMLRVWLSDV